jgi:hypothetical protein
MPAYGLTKPLETTKFRSVFSMLEFGKWSWYQRNSSASFSGSIQRSHRDVVTWLDGYISHFCTLERQQDITRMSALSITYTCIFPKSTVAYGTSQPTTNNYVSQVCAKILFVNYLFFLVRLK